MKRLFLILELYEKKHDKMYLKSEQHEHNRLQLLSKAEQLLQKQEQQ